MKTLEQRVAKALKHARLAYWQALDTGADDVCKEDLSAAEESLTAVARRMRAKTAGEKRKAQDEQLAR